MKKSTGIKIFAFAVIAVMVTACSKYEEGSKFTVLSKKARMTNTWTLSSYTIGTTDVTTATSLDLQKDGVLALTTSGVTESGSWAFNDDKSELVITGLNLLATYNGNYEIIMLKNKELKIRQTNTILTVAVISNWHFTGA